VARHIDKKRNENLATPKVGLMKLARIPGEHRYAPKLNIGVLMLSETVRADAREGDIRMQLGEIARAQHECGAARPRCT
jgi:hypothetical protein